ncbi:endolysin [Arthrobacter phage BaileyBlu]|uniref:Endolysin n=1 Tax=Arthrobacter phage BaileyBlu TaxID=2910754 RepID=A0AA49BNH9_9CAUD|nr:endolysin [Arthrobacter phage BaileyBlu]UJQ87159.1 endolysin [Arthrobacter phage BaileyBlu]
MTVVTRLNWDVIDTGTSPRLVNFPWVTGKVRGGDHAVVLDYIARRWDAEVEPIVKAHSWGWAKRPVRGFASIPSEHSAGVALDFNAPDHPLGVPASKTLSVKQIAAIRQIMKDVKGAARWGGEWSRPDAMHVELMGGNALMKRVADEIRAGKLPGLKAETVVVPAGSKTPAKAPAKIYPAIALPSSRQHTIASHNAWVHLMREIGRKEADLGRALQLWLAGLGYYKGKIDGKFGPMSVKALQRFLAAKGHYTGKIDGKRENLTVAAEIAYLNAQRRYL